MDHADAPTSRTRAIMELLCDQTLGMTTSERALFLLGVMLERTQELGDRLPPHRMAEAQGDRWSILGHLFEADWESSTTDRALILLGVAAERTQHPVREVMSALSGPQWQMSTGERAVALLIALALAPEVAVDAGTFIGGSAAGLSPFCGRVITIDRDQAREVHVSALPNVEFRCGTASDVLAGVLDEHPETEMVILDADHGEDGIAAEIREVLRHPAERIRAVMVHDSAMASCRRGLESIRWSDEPMVRGVTLDLLPGSLNQDGEMVGGMALFWLYSGTGEGSLS